MEKYNINISYGNEDINVLMIKVLLKEINKIIFKKDDFDTILDYNYLSSLKDGGKR